MAIGRHKIGHRKFAAVAGTAAAVVATATLSVNPANSVPDTGCPAPYPTEDLVMGATVDGLTVTSGTAPGVFAGTVQGVLEDGIAPGVDMILADLHSAVIDEVGIWSGMSGSPVYAVDGRLIGAVAYGLGFGPSTIAGITPASEMTRLLNGAPLADREPARTVPVPRAVAARILRSGSGSRADVQQGFTRLPVPVRVSGLTSERMTKMAKVLHLGRQRVVAGAAGPTSQESIDIEAGGNMAASMSYGTVTAAGLGTATMVCGDEVVGFGHPMNFSGPSTMGLHGARALLIQDDPTFSGFKVANLGAPVGTVDSDRAAGVHAAKGALPGTIPVTSRATLRTRTDTATTRITLTDPNLMTEYGPQPELVTQLGFLNIVAAQDRVFDKISSGTAVTSWTIKGLRKNGRPWELNRRNLFTDPYDASAASAIAVANDLAVLQDNSGEQVRISSVNTSTRLRSNSDTFVVAKVQVPVRDKWTTASTRRPLALRAGRVARLKVFITSRSAATRTLRLNLSVPQSAAGKKGWLSVVGGNDGNSDSGEFFDDSGAFDEFVPSPSTFPKLLKQLESTQRNNEARATLRLRGYRHGASTRTRHDTTRIQRAVSGRLAYRVVGRR
jgi:hypothetical protein